MRSQQDSAWVEQRAFKLGFALCGVVKAEAFPELARTKEWLERGYAGQMNYLSDPRRCDPRSVMEGIRSVIVCALSYNTDQPRSTDLAGLASRGEPRGWVSRYAWGSDYHEVMREKLESLAEALYERYQQPFLSRVYVDTGPLSERVLAKHAGLGWVGKNTLLLNQRAGSFFFLGVILTTLELTPSLGPAEPRPVDLCGSCRRCIDACPTEALVEPYLMDARRCIAYLTIEHRGSIPEELREGIGWQVFGCDICQDVCPWNRRAPVTSLPNFQPRKMPEATASGEDADSLFMPRLARLAAMTEADYRQAFRGSPVKRAKWRGLVRNACIALGNAAPALPTIEPPKRQQTLELLGRLCRSPEPEIAESARWALSRIQAEDPRGPAIPSDKAPGV
jgi:epoxyqueuosine reductase